MSKMFYIAGLAAFSAIIFYQYTANSKGLLSSGNMTQPQPVVTISQPQNIVGNFMQLLQTKYDQNIKLRQEFDKVVELSKSKKGTYGFYIKDLRSKKEYKYNEAEDFYAASLFKIPIAIATAKAVDQGLLEWNSIGLVFERLIKNSDNNAQIALTNMLSKNLVTDTFALFTGNNQASKFYIQNHSTPLEQGLVYETLYNDTSYITYDSKKYLIQTMSKTSFDDRIAKYLAPDLIFAHKIGNWGETGSWHDCGIIYGDKEYIVCVMSKNTIFIDFIEVTNELGKIF